MMKSKKKKEGKKKRDNNAWLNISKLNRTFLAPATILGPGGVGRREKSRGCAHARRKEKVCSPRVAPQVIKMQGRRKSLNVI